MKLFKSQITSTKLQINLNDQNFKSQTFWSLNIDGFVKNPLGPLIVIPAKAGIQSFQAIMDSCLRRNDAIFDFLRIPQFFVVLKTKS